MRSLALGAALAVGGGGVRDGIGAHGREAPDLRAEGGLLAAVGAGGAGDGGLDLDVRVDAVRAAVARNLGGLARALLCMGAAMWDGRGLLGLARNRLWYELFSC